MTSEGLRAGRQSLGEQVYHHEKRQRKLEAEQQSKMEQESGELSGRQRSAMQAQTRKERIKKFTEANQRKMFLRAEKPIAKLKHAKKSKQKAAP